MRTIQVIQLHGRAVALALGDQAIVADHVSGEERSIVAAMALYALEIQTSARPEPYTDTAAERYARHALTQRAARLPRTRRGANDPPHSREQPPHGRRVRAG